MPAGKNSLIDNDFIEEGDDLNLNDRNGDQNDLEVDFGDSDPFHDPHEKERAEFEGREPGDKPAKNQRDRKDQKGKKNDKDADDLEVEVVDDTPDEDRNKWVADDDRDGEPDLPNEDEVKKYSKDVQERISKMTARIHAERRAKEERDRQLNEALDLARRYLTESNRLKEIVEGGEKVLHGEHKARLEGQLAGARAKYREASDAGDTNGIMAANEEIARIVAQLDRASTYRPQQLPRENEQEVFGKFAAPQPGQPQVTSEALQWKEKNPWFDTDVAMRNHALTTHGILVHNGVKPDTPDYYKRIDAEMRKRFPERFKGQADQNGPSQGRRRAPVASPSRDGGGSVRKVTLTETQARIARRLGLTNKQMAEQILKEQENGNGREYTHGG